jgi:cyclase
MEPRAVSIVATGSANLASVRRAVERRGHLAIVTDDPHDVVASPRLILPGVGAFGAAMKELAARGLVEALQHRLLGGMPTLCICLGMQLLCESSEESPGVRGLGVVPGHITRFAAGEGVRVPQLGWNLVTPTGDGMFMEPGWAYYANSYRLAEAPAGWNVAVSEHGGPFIGAMQRGGVLACQFHPELSSTWGSELIGRWLDGTPALSTGALRTSARKPPVSRVIPCLDVANGRVVKGVRFANLRDMGDPATMAAAYESQGADELVMLDVCATIESRRAAVATVQAVRRSVSIPVTVGGGVATVDDAKALLDVGADKVAINSAAVQDPALIARLATRFGRQCVVVAIDAARDASRPGDHWNVVVRSGRERTSLDVVEWAREAASRGAGEVLLTSRDRDGTRDGYDLALLEAVCGGVEIPVIASGGAHSPDHLAAALASGASAVLAASIFHEAEYTVGHIKAALSSRGMEVRS